MQWGSTVLMEILREVLGPVDGEHNEDTLSHWCLEICLYKVCLTRTHLEASTFTKKDLQHQVVGMGIPSINIFMRHKITTADNVALELFNETMLIDFALVDIHGFHNLIIWLFFFNLESIPLE